MAKKAKKVEEPKPELTIFDWVGVEMKMTPLEMQKGKPYTKELFKMWCVLPETFKGAPDRITDLLGVKDQTTLKLLATGTITAFSATYNVGLGTLFKWKKEIEESVEYQKEVDRFFKPLTKNVTAALYRKMLEEGDAPRFMAWMKVIEGWKEQLGIDHSGSVGDGLTPEERTALDNLLAKNTV